MLGEEVPVALHEPVEVLLAMPAGLPGLDHAVQLGQHVLEPTQLFGRKILHARSHVPEVGSEHLVLEPIQQLVELLLGSRVVEAVVLELTDGPRRIRRQRGQELLLQPGIVFRLEREGAPLRLQDVVQALLDLPKGPLQVHPLHLLPASVP